MNTLINFLITSAILYGTYRFIRWLVHEAHRPAPAPNDFTQPTPRK